MGMGRIRWWLALLAWLACLLVPACSETKAQPGASKAPKGLQASQEPPAAREVPGLARPAPPTKKKSASGPGRRHPFVPVVDPKALRGQTGEAKGPLSLKGILDGPTRVALIEQGATVHFAQEGEIIDGLKVLAIREDEVVLEAGQRKCILSLYER